MLCQSVTDLYLKTDKTVAFFFIISNGLMQVRRINDYVPKMIELAGGRYILEDLGDEDSDRSAMNMQIEEVYDRARTRLKNGIIISAKAYNML